ncbi:MAG TPA: FMN-binding protein [Thermodesulfovibrionales bacterium]|nr:FMN-binding protein [Thermodesulfovibrionales bacterium]
MSLRTFSSRLLRVIHILLAGVISGGYLGILLLVLIKRTMHDEGMMFPLDLSILRLFTWSIAYPAFVLIITSCLYSLFFGWGITRYYWVLIKWVGLILLFIIAWFGLGPAAGGVASISDAGFHLSTMKGKYVEFGNSACYYSALGLGIMVAMTFVAVFRPFGSRKEKEINIEKIISAVLLILVIVGIVSLVASELMLTKYRKMPIADSALHSLEDGVYFGESRIGNYAYKVEVKVTGHRIDEIRTIDRKDSLFAQYAEGVFSRIIRDQNANTDAITGATTTSKAYMKAVEQALSGKIKKE